MMLRRGLMALLLGVVATLFEPAVGFLIPSGPGSKAVVGRAREQHHQPLTAAGVTVPPAAGFGGRRRGRGVGPLRMGAETDAEASKVEEEMHKIKPMKIKEIKEELDERGVGYQDLLEKAEFMRRLAESRVKGITKPPPAAEGEEAPSAAAAAAASAGPTAGEAAASTAGTSSSASSGPSPSASASASASAGGAGEKKEAAAAKAVDEAVRYEKALEEIMKMRVSEIKQELDLLKVSHKGLFEKREFAEVLAKARLAPENRGANMDPDEDPSEYRTVKVTRMPRDDRGGAGGGPGAGAGAGAGGPQRGGPGAGGSFGGGDPFSASGARAARGGAGFGGFGSMFDGFGGAGGPFGGAGGGGMGGFDPSILQKVMSNPRAAAAFQRAQSNPRIMAAVQEMAKNPAAIQNYMNDPEILSVLKELQSVFR